LKVDGFREDEALGGGEVVVDRARHTESVRAW
jgi:hypothetical protein